MPLESRGYRRFSEEAQASSFEGFLSPERWASSRPVVFALTFAAIFFCRQSCFFFPAEGYFQSLGEGLLEREESSCQPSRPIYPRPLLPSLGSGFYIGSFPGASATDVLAHRSVRWQLASSAYNKIDFPPNSSLCAASADGGGRRN